MSYTANIPQGNDRLSQSQGQILNNFQALNTSNSVNHVAYNDPNQGKHNLLQMPEQSSDPTTLANEGTLYCKEFDIDGMGLLRSTVFFRNESSGDITTFGGPSLRAPSGYTYIPGGLLVQWNTLTVTSNNSVTFPITFGAAPYYVSFMVTGASPNNRVFTRIEGNPIAASFIPRIVNRDNNDITAQINWIAIGSPM